MKLIPITMATWLARLKCATFECEGCHRSSTLRPHHTAQTGIRLSDRWYCSAHCFRAAAEREVARLLKLRVEQPLHASRMPLGLSLIRRELLTIEQWKKVNEEQKEAGGDLGEILVRQGLVSEKQVTAIRAAVWGCPVFTVPSHAGPVEVNIPATLMRNYSMVPVHYVASTNLLLVGFVRSVEYGLLSAVEHITGSATKPCFVTPTDFELQMKQQEKMHAAKDDAPAGELSFEGIQTPAEIAGILCKSGLEIEADEALMERCKDYVWARLKSVPRAVDLLFKTG